MSYFSFLDREYVDKTYFGIYNSGGVIAKEYQNKGLYQKIRNCFTINDLDFISTRTQNLAVFKAFKKNYSNFIPDKKPNNSQKEIGQEIAKYLNSEKSFDSNSFICKNIYESSRNNTGLIKGLNPTDAYILLHTRK